MRKRVTTRRIVGAVTLVAVVAIILSILVPTIRHGFDDTAAVATWAVALGTLALAAATYEVARRARDEAEAVRKEAIQVTNQVTLQREQMADSRRAYVYPSVPSDWARGDGDWRGRHQTALPLANGGPGLALNVRGRAVWNLGSGQWATIHIFGSSIAPGTSTDARLDYDANLGWGGAFGYVQYSDLLEDEWVTYFRFTDRQELTGLLIDSVKAPQLIDELVENPALLDEAGLAAIWTRAR